MDFWKLDKKYIWGNDEAPRTKFALGFTGWHARNSEADREAALRRRSAGSSCDIRKPTYGTHVQRYRAISIWDVTTAVGWKKACMYALRKARAGSNILVKKMPGWYSPALDRRPRNQYLDDLGQAGSTDI